MTDTSCGIESKLPRRFSALAQPSPRARSWLIWLPAPLPAGLVLAGKSAFPAWVWMWLIAGALFVGAKWITVSRFLRSVHGANTARLIAYCVLWPGLDIQAFCATEEVERPSFGEWSGAAGKMILGGLLTWASLASLNAHEPLLVGWLGMIGLVLVLHFGIFHVLSLVWRARGLKAKPIMQSPATATSLRKFWAGRWNAGFSDLVHKYLLRGLSGYLGAQSGLLAVFLISGLVHELVISVPAGGGYGRPTLYFAIQGLAVLLERGRLGQGLGLGHGLKGWCYVALVTLTPVGLLFHPPFIYNVILPMLRALSAVL